MFEHFNFSVESQYLIRLLVSCVCGAVFGIERQVKGKPFGIRTCVLISLGSTVFVYLGQMVVVTQGDPSRVIGQVVSGIGFLGAGAILQKNGMIHGITSAATIWLIAAVGVAAGLGQLGIALITTFLAIAVLVLTQKIEESIKSLRKGPYHNN
jgi:putative Mg2+ transporter-C (MgtC) family protein